MNGGPDACARGAPRAGARPPRRTPAWSEQGADRRAGLVDDGGRARGHRNRYAPGSSSAQTRTVRSRARSRTAPQLGQSALMVVTDCGIGTASGPLEAQMPGPSGADPERPPTDGLERAVAADHLRPPGRPGPPPREHPPGLPARPGAGAAGLETDAWLSADGEVVLVHDASVQVRRAGIVPRRLARRDATGRAPRPRHDVPACATSTTSSAPTTSSRSTSRTPTSAPHDRRRSPARTATRRGCGCAARRDARSRALREHRARRAPRALASRESRSRRRRSSATPPTSPAAASTR